MCRFFLEAEPEWPNYYLLSASVAHVGVGVSQLGPICQQPHPQRLRRRDGYQPANQSYQTHTPLRGLERVPLGLEPESKGKYLCLELEFTVNEAF